MKELSETMVEYWDEGEHQRDHEAFKKWQSRNGGGFVLNSPINEPANIFHKSGCDHIIDHSSPNVSLTENRKVCSTIGGELTTYASNQPKGWRRCATCSRKSHKRLWS
jgi:hypothetical protein